MLPVESVKDLDFRMNFIVETINVFQQFVQCVVHSDVQRF